MDLKHKVYTGFKILDILNDSVKFRETAIKSKAWDGALEDRCNLYVCYDEKTANYYLFEVLR